MTQPHRIPGDPQIALPEQHDQYVAALERLAEAKAAGGQLEPPAEPPHPVDLMAALEASIDAARGGQS
ncbi:hypothetical protein V7793_06130 [Streptomyces sp. KLMMK]|uniref:hypothetical protein n=1 Tax=Streptomyces sp. KLMMK TaxID=3109353 RepID=UPI0030008DCC